MGDIDDIINLGAERQARQKVKATEPPFSEDHVAGAFAVQAEGRFRYCVDAGRWHRWTGCIWEPDRVGSVLHEVRLLARELAKSEPVKARVSAGRSGFVSGAERLSRADPVLVRTSACWDIDHFKMGSPGGMIDLRTGGLVAADPAEGITKAVAVDPAPAADCPRWIRFLTETTGGDIELIEFLKRWCGYALTGDVREHALLFLYGLGGNGKSVFLNTVTRILKDYAVTAAMETFTASSSDKHPADLAMLRGARLVTASETEEGRAWAEARIKAMTGGDPITARFMRQDFFTYQPQFKLTVVGNHKPVLQNVDDAARRRFNIAPFVLKPEVPDRELEAKLVQEWPAILRWMIDGCLAWQAEGLSRPASVVAATETYFADQDVFGQWVEDECFAEPGNSHRWETAAKLFGAWKAYGERLGLHPGNGNSFAEAMARKGFERSKGAKGVRIFRGVDLVSP